MTVYKGMSVSDGRRPYWNAVNETARRAGTNGIRSVLENEYHKLHGMGDETFSDRVLNSTGEWLDELRDSYPKNESGKRSRVIDYPEFFAGPRKIAGIAISEIMMHDPEGFSRLAEEYLNACSRIYGFKVNGMPHGSDVAGLYIFRNLFIEDAKERTNFRLTRYPKRLSSLYAYAVNKSNGTSSSVEDTKPMEVLLKDFGFQENCIDRILLNGRNKSKKLRRKEAIDSQVDSVVEWLRRNFSQ
ncbi:hypothetical protein HY501_00340 [Candidatus Woesearchaeota archaeon]|nr:hypothetical protein [Candidatus Woesearchaeota archaeon]